ncbi:acyltransferase family protein [Georgenia sp. SUBG003]|uniref:acyltransferase family protein n=1 Tax=Georgenia sp. SUBG003 TaxID=1497974 RepID=UPI003AB48FEE
MKVILPTYAVLFLVAVAVARLPDAWLLVCAAGATVLGPLVWIAGQRGTDFDMEPATLANAPAEILSAVVLSGPYPVVTWVAPFLLGMWLGRRDLTDAALQVRLAVVGAAAGIGGMVVSRVLVGLVGQPGEEVGPDRLVSAVAHSQMPLWLLSGTGSAVLVVAVALLLVPRAGAWVRPLVAVGQLSLTVYVAHLFVIAALVRPGPGSAADGLVSASTPPRRRCAPSSAAVSPDARPPAGRRRRTGPAASGRSGGCRRTGRRRRGRRGSRGARRRGRTRRGTESTASRPMPITAVTTSTKKTATIEKLA